MEIVGRKFACSNCGMTHDIVGIRGQEVVAKGRCECGQKYEMTTVFES